MAARDPYMAFVSSASCVLTMTSAQHVRGLGDIWSTTWSPWTHPKNPIHAGLDPGTGEDHFLLGSHTPCLHGWEQVGQVGEGGGVHG